MPTDLLAAAVPTVQPTWASRSQDTVRAIWHARRQPSWVVGTRSRRLDVIPEKTLWLADMLEGVIGNGSDDIPARIDVVDIAARCVSQARPITRCDIHFSGVDQAVAVAPPVALHWAISCALYHAMRAAGPLGHISVAVTGTDSWVTVQVIDDGAEFCKVPTDSSFGLTVTRALVSACGGAFELNPDPAHTVVAQILLPAAAAPVTS